MAANSGAPVYIINCYHYISDLIRPFDVAMNSTLNSTRITIKLEPAEFTGYFVKVCPEGSRDSQYEIGSLSMSVAEIRKLSVSFSFTTLLAYSTHFRFSVNIVYSDNNCIRYLADYSASAMII
jgi:hypothetical protein